jgi:hypothetical protein
MSKMSATEIEGVFAKGRKFVALIYVRGQRRFLGSYANADQAAAKVSKMAKAHAGEWAA